MSTFSDLKNEFYRYVSDEIDNINSERGFVEYRAELYRHYLLCGIELKLNGVFESEIKIIIGELLLRVNSSGFSEFMYLQDVLNICNHSNISCLDGTVKYKLLAQFLYFDFDSSSMSFFCKLLEIKILSAGRFEKNKMECKYDDEMDRVFLRVLFFCEFEILKKQIVNNSNKMHGKFNFNNIVAGNIKEIRECLIFINKEINNVGKLFNSDVRNVAGLFGAFFFIEEKWRNEYSSNSQVDYIPDYNKPISSFNDCEDEVDHDDELKKVCAEYAQIKMKEYGYTLYPRAYYNNYGRLHTLCRFVKVVFDDVSICKDWNYNFVDQLCFNDSHPEIYETGFKQAIDGLQKYKPKKIVE